MILARTSTSGLMIKASIRAAVRKLVDELASCATSERRPNASVNRGVAVLKAPFRETLTERPCGVEMKVNLGRTERPSREVRRDRLLDDFRQRGLRHQGRACRPGLERI